MAALPEARKFGEAVLSVRGEEPLLLGLIGPPGGGKTVSALRLATGMRRVRPGPVVLIDTEGGRSRKYSPEQGKPVDPTRLIFDFRRVDMTPPFRSHDFLAAIKAQLPLNPAAIIVDTMSDEHEGEGGFLEWHDAIANLKRGEPGYVGGNEWAAWGLPKAARKRLITGLLQIRVPLLFTFRAREKTKTDKVNGKDQIVNIGYMPVAPLEIVHTLDLTCILPPRADGVPVWTSEKLGEDFIIKRPAFLSGLIKDGALSEDTGEALARWAKGEGSAATPGPTPAPAPGLAPGGDGGAPLLDEIREVLRRHKLGSKSAAGPVQLAFGTDWAGVCRMDVDGLRVGLAALKHNLDGVAAMRERQPGEDE